MRKSSTPVKVTVKVAAELAAVSAIMLGAGAFSMAAPAASDNTSSTTVQAYYYHYSPGAPSAAKYY